MKITRASLLALAMAVAAPSFAGAEGLDCKLHYKLDGWSMVYSSATGSGTVDCANKQSMPVKISAKALGATVGKWRIDKGTGRFTDVQNINDVLGTYAKGEINAGLAKSGSLQVLTKGNVSLALAGKGEGVNLGVEVGGFTIERVK